MAGVKGKSGRKGTKKFENAASEFIAGLGKTRDIASKYNLNRTALYNYLHNKNIKKNHNLASGFNSIVQGLNILETEQKKILTEAKSNSKEAVRNQAALIKGFEYLERYGEFGAFAVSVAKKILNKSNEMADEVATPTELKAVADSAKISFEMLGLMPPKNPLIAIQNNINKIEAENNKKEIEIRFIDSGDKSDIIDIDIEQVKSKE